MKTEYFNMIGQFENIHNDSDIENISMSEKKLRRDNDDSSSFLRASQ